MPSLHECFTWAAEQVLRSADAFPCTCKEIRRNITFSKTNIVTPDWYHKEDLTATSSDQVWIEGLHSHINTLCLSGKHGGGEVSEGKCQGTQWVQPQCKRLFPYSHLVILWNCSAAFRPSSAIQLFIWGRPLMPVLCNSCIFHSESGLGWQAEQTGCRGRVMICNLTLLALTQRPSLIT